VVIRFRIASLISGVYVLSLCHGRHGSTHERFPHFQLRTQVYYFGTIATALEVALDANRRCLACACLFRWLALGSLQVWRQRLADQQRWPPA
jgi:hypothetical protein